MRILGIDPGNVKSAYVIWDGVKIMQMGDVENADIMRLISSASYDSLAIESITGYGMAVGTEVFETCRWEGKFEYLASDLTKKPFRRIRRRDIKSHICENPTAKDRDILAALTDKIGPKGTKANPGPTFGVSGDIWAALAVAVYALETGIFK
jgi:hypothetical protein